MFLRIRVLSAWSLTAAICFGSSLLAPLYAQSFSSVARGAARDNAPQTGSADQLVLDTGLSSNVNGDQWRVINEFDISSIEGTVIDASIRGSVVPNNSSDTGERGHLFEVFAGNGTLDLADYNAPGTEVGSLSHPSGGRTDYEFDVTTELANLVTGGDDYFALRVSPMNNPQGFDVVTSVTLDVLTLPPGATLAMINPTVDAQAFVGDGIAGINEGGNALLAYDRSSGNDDRAVMEFDLSAIPAGATISNAWIDLDIFSFTFSGSNFPEPLFYGYAGNGTAEPSDATELSNLLGVSNPVMDGGDHRVMLNPAVVQAIVAGGATHLGILGVGDPDHDQLQFWATEAAAFADPPKLNIAYEAAPTQSADYNNDGSIDAIDYAVWREALGATGAHPADGTGDGLVDGDDFNLWKEQYGQAAGEPVENGDFETGDLTGWEVVVTPNGNQFSGFPRVESFDVDGDGESSLAYRTRVGQQTIDFDNPAGAGIGQDVMIAVAGDYELSLDVAAYNLSGNSNSGPGRFELWFDGMLMDVVDMNECCDGINPGEIRRDSLQANLLGVTPGEYRVEVLILRPYTLGSAIYQYLDDIRLQPFSGAAVVPEPATWLFVVLASQFTALRKQRYS